jgi:hypothetical protein
MHGTSQGEVPFPLDSFGGLVSLAAPESLPQGASPRTWDADYDVGRAKTRDGLARVYNQSTASVGPNSPATASSSTWNNPDGLIGSSSFASFSPASAENLIQATGFSFALSSIVVGLQFTVTAVVATHIQIAARLLSGGVPIGVPRMLFLSAGTQTLTFGSMTDQWGGVTAAQINALDFGIEITIGEVDGFSLASISLQNLQATVFLHTGTQTMQPFSTFVAQNGLRYNLLLDSGGNLWVEDLDTNPNVIATTRTGIVPGTMSVFVQGEGVEYMTIVRPLSLGGADMPLQWNPNWCDRITQVGPGAAPVFTPSTASDQDYAIASITQPPIQVTSQPGRIDDMLLSAGPGSTGVGNVVTVYYLQNDHGPQDLALQTAFNSGKEPVYVWISGGAALGNNSIQQVTSIGSGVPPGGAAIRWYFTFVANETAYLNFGGGAGAQPGTYQMTVATLMTTTPVPNLEVGNMIVITGATPPAWNGTWTVTQTPNASEMVITGSMVSGGTATYNYAVTNDSANPAVGQLVTVTNTLNAGGQLNVTQATIASVSGSSVGTFTITGFPATLTAAFQAENGYADTAGTIFMFDPGAQLFGTSSDPIFGNAGAGGNVVFNSSGVYVDPGTYQGTVFFITRNGYYTCPAPPVVFTVPDNTTQLTVTNIPLGPPNVVARGIAITEAGQNGIPGGNFFTLPDPVVFYVEGVKQTATAFFVNDNATTQATLFFTSDVLNSAEAIDVYGYNLFNQIELCNPSFLVNYDERNFYGGCINKVQNFINLSFDGGFLAQNNPQPLGWSTPDQYGSLAVSPRFGNSYYIKNTTGGTLATAGVIYQTAYQDANQIAIVNPNTGYSVNVTARIPSSLTTGSLVVALVAGSVILGQFSIPFASMTSAFAVYTGTILLDPGIASVPANARLYLGAENIGAGADVEIDRIDPFPTDIPVLATTLYGSYAGEPEQVDGVTGQVIFTSENQQPIQACKVLYDTLYAMKGWLGTAPGSSLYSLRASPDLEPADWDEPEVSQRSGGAVGVFANAGGEQWFLAASRAGIYLFVGGQPGKIMQEVQEVWDSIYWPSAGSIWMDVDLKARKMYIGIPLSTPNFWLPYAPVNATPTSPNVVLMCNFQGLDSGEELKAMPQMHTTMFGTLTSVDMRRKWNLWQITSPYATTVQGVTDEQTRFGNGQGNSLAYAQIPGQPTDDGAIIDSCYTTSGLPLQGKRGEMPQLAGGRITWCYLAAALTSGGTVNLRLLANRLFFPEPAGYEQWTVPGGFAPGAQPLNDMESTLNFTATRTFFEFRQNDGNPGWTLSNMTLKARKSVWNTLRGIKS